MFSAGILMRIGCAAGQHAGAGRQTLPGAAGSYPPLPHLACAVDAQVQRVAAARGEGQAHIVIVDL